MDAHARQIDDWIRVQRLAPVIVTPFVAHQTHPASLLALARQMHGKAPSGVLLSLRGYNLSFGDGLCPETEESVAPAVERILERL